MRPGLVLILLAACSSSAPPGPAWPTLSPRADDGGESIAPREVARGLAAIEDDKAAEPAATEPPADAPAGAPAATPDPPATTSPAADAATTAEESLTTEEIVIEVADGD